MNNNLLHVEIHIGKEGRTWNAEILTTTEVQARALQAGKVLPRRRSGADKWNIIARAFSQEECVAACGEWLKKNLRDSVAMVKTF